MRWRREKLEEEAKAYLEAHPETIHIDAFIIDLCGRAVGKRYPVDDLAKMFSSGSQLCAATYLLDACGNSVDPLGYGLSDGDPDVQQFHFMKEILSGCSLSKLDMRENSKKKKGYGIPFDRLATRMIRIMDILSRFIGQTMKWR